MGKTKPAVRRGQDLAKGFFLCFEISFKTIECYLLHTTAILRILPLLSQLIA